jgi:hypothetical protein
VDPNHSTNRGMRPQDSSIPPLPQRFLIYSVLVVLAVGGAVAGVRWLGLRGEEALMVEGSVLFLIAGSGRAPRLFSAVRQAGELRGVSNEQVMRSILIIIAVLILLAVWLPRVLGPST